VHNECALAPKVNKVLDDYLEYAIGYTNAYSGRPIVSTALHEHNKETKKSKSNCHLVRY
jgi:hypothetical protein